MCCDYWIDDWWLKHITQNKNLLHYYIKDCKLLTVGDNRVSMKLLQFAINYVHDMCAYPVSVVPFIKLMWYN